MAKPNGAAGLSGNMESMLVCTEAVIRNLSKRREEVAAELRDLDTRLNIQRELAMHLHAGIRLLTLREDDGDSKPGSAE